MSINAHDEPKHACRIGIQVLPLYFISVVGPAAAALGLVSAAAAAMAAAACIA
jgi:hypothetical protein